jgi:hypothetical protein
MQCASDSVIRISIMPLAASSQATFQRMGKRP